MRNSTLNILSALDNADRNGTQIDANQLISGSFMAVFGDSDVAGTFKIQASNDVCPPLNSQNFTVTNWVDIPTATASVASGASALIVIPQMCFRWVRAVFVHASGGTGGGKVNVTMNVLGL